MSDTQALLSALGKPFPKEAIKTRQGGGGAKFDYVAGHTVIHRLNDATGGMWSWHVKSFDFRPAGTDRYGKEQHLVVVTGELTIDGLGTRAGIGVQKVTENGGEDLVKGASTDALKKAATLFGVALELYGEDYEDAPPSPAFDKVLDQCWTDYENGKTLDSIKDYLNAHRHSMSKEQLQVVRVELGKIEQAITERAAPAVAG